MNPDLSRRAHELFRQALDLEPGERAPFLDRVCDGSPELRAEVEALVDSDTEAGDFLESILERSVDLLEGEGVSSARIGPYRLLHQIGRGGMGAVYLAERDEEEFFQRVAIKLVKPGMDSATVLRRFREERQILARLEHPNIARLLDGGSTDTGAPYLVMEYVEGEPIDHYCRRHRLGVEKRLELFFPVCAAVHYAHQNLVVHRDLKPSNILVTGDGTVKLLDFGIAKLLEPSGVGDATATIERVLTPLYASPEQLLGEPITTASDVYGLGTVLYELLSRRRPFELEGRSLSEVQRVVCEQEPEAPSRAVTRLEGGEEGQRADRGALRRRLSGDLDTIVLRAISKEPSRRYASAEQLAADLDRHRAGLPVIARRDTFLYRSSKFLRRHRAAAAVALLFLILGISFLINRSLQSARIARERDRAEEVSAVLIDLFEVSDPGEALGNTITAREILDVGAQRIRRELADQPLVRARLMQTMGVVYGKLGLYQAAEDLLAEAVAELRSHAGPRHADVAPALNELAKVLDKRGKSTAAYDAALEALEIGTATLGERNLVVAKSLNTLGTVLWQRGDLASAENHHRRALELRRELPGTPPRDVAESLNELGLVLEDLGDKGSAESLYRESLEIKRSALNEDHPDTVATLNNLALLLQGRGDLAAAEDYLRRILEIDRRVLGNDHPYVAQTLENLAGLLEERGAAGEAEALYLEMLDLRRRVLSEDHPDIANSLLNLAYFYNEQGDFRAAEVPAREAIAIHQRRGEYHRGHGTAVINLVVILINLGAYAEAREVLERSLALAQEQELAGLEGDSRHNLAWLQQETGDLAAAESLYRRALELRIELLGERDIDVAYSMAGVAWTLRDQGDYEQAEPMALRAVELFAEIKGPEHPATASQKAHLARLLHLWGRSDEAEDQFEEAVDLLKRRVAEGHPRLATALTHFGALLVDSGQAARAEPLLRQALSGRRAAVPSGHPRIAETEMVLASCLLALGRSDEARPLLRHGLEILESRTGGAHPALLRARSQLATLEGR